jgi:hypothetical protein
LSTRSSLPVVGASPVPYHPALTKRDTMPKDDPQSSSEVLPMASHRSRVAFVLFILVLALLVAVSVAVTRADGEDPVPSAPSTARAAGSPTTTTATVVSRKTEVTSRLREILQVRDKALVARDSELLNGIYTIDCKCLKDGRALIQQLHEENILWKGVATNIAIKDIEEVNSRLWVVVATVETPPVRIETEAGKLIRIVPAERNLVRFALAKPQNEDEWLLGHVSSVS